MKNPTDTDKETEIVDELALSEEYKALIHRMEYVYGILQECVSGCIQTIDFKTYCQSNGMGCISITGEKIDINDLKLFQDAVLSSDVIEVFPKVDGTIQIDFTLYGSTK